MGRIEETILDQKFHSDIEILNLSILHLEIDFLQSWGPLRLFAHRNPMVSFNCVVSLITVDPALNPLYMAVQTF